jgi:hypothetical protein
MRSILITTKYKSAKPVKTKSKEVKKESYHDKYSALLSELTAISSRLAVFYPAIDKLMDTDLRNQIILDRALKLAPLPPEQLALDLAKSKILLELMRPFYKETMQQLRLFQNKYEQEIAKQYRAMEKRSEAKNASSPHQENFKIAEQILVNQKKYDYTTFRRKLKRALGKEIPESTARSYFKKITGLTSTKNSHHLSDVNDSST